jgi:hypothetical protein
LNPRWFCHRKSVENTFLFVLCCNSYFILDDVMRIVMLFPALLLAACQTMAPTEAVGSQAWLEQVDRQLAVSDGQGHGPDYGSQEWCNVVHFRLYGKASVEPVPCDQAWMEKVDQEMKKR